MRFLLHIMVIGTAALLATDCVWAQSTGASLGPPSNGIAPLVPKNDKEIIQVRMLETAAQPQQDDKLKKQVDLLQKQIETQQKMIELLVDHTKKQPLAGSPVEKLQQQVTTLDARSKQAAQRDQDLGQAVDNLTEHLDAEGRNGPRLPSTLKELFLPSRSNETPLSIYGQLSTGYTQFDGKRGNFAFPDFAPFFLMQLNDRFLLEVELDFSNAGVDVSQAQVDFLVNDWLTVVAGRFLCPVGFFNEKLHPTWINKLPDFPLMFRQVTPSADLSLNGIQLRGATYLGASPIKMEYSTFFTNGLRLNTTTPDVTALADLGPLRDSSHNLNDVFAGGGRLGFWIPELGILTGVSGMFNGPYTTAGAQGLPGGNDEFQVLQIDAGYHKGNWDFRFEYAQMFQDARSFLGERINRRGLYAQVAYRPYDAAAQIIQNTEIVFRYSQERFSGFDQTALDLTAFDSPVKVPVDRNQYTFGINHYFSPSLVVKFAYQINQELGINLRDNVFLAQLAWGF